MGKKLHKPGTTFNNPVAEVARPAVEVAAEKKAAVEAKAAGVEFTRKTTAGVKLTTGRKARKERTGASLLPGNSSGLSDTLG